MKYKVGDEIRHINETKGWRWRVIKIRNAYMDMVVISSDTTSSSYKPGEVYDERLDNQNYIILKRLNNIRVIPWL